MFCGSPRSTEGHHHTAAVNVPNESMDPIQNSSSATDGCPLPLTHVVPMMAVNVLSAIAGSVGNVLVVATVYTTTNLHSISNYFLASMAAADLLVTSFAQPFFVAFLATQTELVCLKTVELIFRVFANVSPAASLLHLCLVSVDRCLIVMKPRSSIKILSKSRFVIVLVLSWLLSILYTILRLTVDKSATAYLAVGAAAVCYVIMIICYGLIVTKVRKQRKRMRTILRRPPVGSVLRDDVERRVTVTIASVITVFTLCWLPIVCLRSSDARSNSGWAYNWARTVLFCNSAMNPLIYCYRNQVRIFYRCI